MTTAPHLTPVPDEPQSAPREATLEEEVQRLAGLLDQTDRITTEVNRIKGRLRDELEPGNHTIAGLKVQISQPTAFSAAKAAAVLTLEQLDAITDETTWVSPVLAAQVLTREQLAAISETKRAISGQLAKVKLDPATYRSCCEPSGAKRVKI